MSRREIPTAAQIDANDRVVEGEWSEKEDAKYASMTPAQREKYYVHPNLWQRLKRFWNP
jgi:hypothetical protein